MPTLHVHFLPAHVPAEELAGSVVIVIDLLRASSTICQALASGATCVMPFLEIDDARRAADLGQGAGGAGRLSRRLTSLPCEERPINPVGRRVPPRR